MPALELGGRSLYWEDLGSGDAILCMGGWGTFCHGRERDLPRSLLQHGRVVVFDYPGLGESSPAPATLTTEDLAQDAAVLLDALGIARAHVVGLVGLGACVAQQLALLRPDLVRSLAMTGTWCRADPTLTDQLELFLDVHQSMGFGPFQRLCAVYSFAPDFYERNRDRILGPEGAWADLNGRAEAHVALVTACLTHDTEARLAAIRAPTLVVHAGADVITGPRLTRRVQDAIPSARGVSWPEAAHIIAGREAKIRLSELLEHFLLDVEASGA